MSKTKTKAKPKLAPTAPAPASVPEPQPAAVDHFAKGASSRVIEAPESLPWDGMDPSAKPTNGINLRLNDYELEVVRWLAKQEDRSLQRILKRILVPALEAEVDRYRTGTTSKPR